MATEPESNTELDPPNQESSLSATPSPMELTSQMGPSSPQRREAFLQNLTRLPFSSTIRTAIMALSLLGATADTEAQPRPPQRIEQTNELSQSTEQELINHLNQILGRDIVSKIINPRYRLSAPLIIEPIELWQRVRDDGLTSYDLDEESPAQRLERKQRDRAQKTALANRLRPFIEEAKTRKLSWANGFDTHLEIPEAPRVEFAEGKFRLFSNLALLGELEKILGQNVVRDTLSTR
ncbi:MAG: hypothetical protein WCX95_01900, partial [Candidatus Gracilibacteria bacterium]